MSTEGMYVALTEAVDHMADTLVAIDTPDEHGRITTWTGMSCYEVESIAEVLRLAGRGLEADTIISFHAEGDDEGDQHHQWEPES